MTPWVPPIPVWKNNFKVSYIFTAHKNYLIILKDDVAALGFGCPEGSPSYNPSDSSTVLNTGACEVMRNHMQVIDSFNFLSVRCLHILSEQLHRVKNVPCVPWGVKMGINLQWGKNLCFLNTSMPPLFLKCKYHRHHRQTINVDCHNTMIKFQQEQKRNLHCTLYHYRKIEGRKWY